MELVNPIITKIENADSRVTFPSVVRVSLGAMSSEHDVDAFVAFLRDTYVDAFVVDDTDTDTSGSTTSTDNSSTTALVCKAPYVDILADQDTASRTLEMTCLTSTPVVA